MAAARPPRAPATPTVWRLPVAVFAGVLAAVAQPILPAQADPGGAGRSRSVEALASRLEASVRAEEEARHHEAIDRVRQGAPPGALVAFLVAVREHPKPVFREVLGELATYRRPAVRGQAVAAWVELSERDAAQAIAQAADDPDRGVRRLAYVLAQAHTTPAVEETIQRMLARDPALAEELDAGAALVPDEGSEGPEGDDDDGASQDDAVPDPAEELEEIVIFDEDAPDVGADPVAPGGAS